MQRILLPEQPRQTMPQGKNGLYEKALASQQDYLLPGYGYEITRDEAETLRAAAREILARFDEAMDYVVATPDVLRKFYFFADDDLNCAIQDIAAASWRNPRERGYLLDRLDLAFDGNAVRLLERNFGFLGLIAGTGVVQPAYIGWLRRQPGFADARDFGSLPHHFVRALGEVARRHGLPPHGDIMVTVPPEQEGLDPGISAAGEALTRWTEAAGFDATKCPTLSVGGLTIHQCLPQGVYLAQNDGEAATNMLSLSRKNAGELRKRHGDYVSAYPTALHLFYGYEQHVTDLARALIKGKPVGSHIKMLRAPWEMLAGNKAMLAVLDRMFPGHPHFPEARFGSGGVPGSKSFVKHCCLSQGRESRFVDEKGELLYESFMIEFDKSTSSGEWTSQLSKQERNPERYISQAYCNEVENPGGDGARKVLHMFTANREPAAIGMRESLEVIVGGQNGTRYLPVVVRPKASAGGPAYGGHKRQWRQLGATL